MSILIKGMEMPKNCSQCFIKDGKCKYRYYMQYSNEEYRPLNCHLEPMPSAQPERKTGEWEEIEVIPKAYDITGVKTWASKMRCDQCNFTAIAIEGHFAQYNFCPSCGARMVDET